MENVYRDVLPFYYLTKTCGFSTYTIGKRPRTTSKSDLNWWNIFPLNAIAVAMAVAIHLTIISTIIYATQCANIIPPTAHVMINVGSQHVITMSVSSIGSTVTFWTWKRQKINGIINEIYLIDKMVLNVCFY